MDHKKQTKGKTRAFCSRRFSVSRAPSILSICFSNPNLISRPGILVLINDCDWELMGGIDYTVEDGDALVFISTLHGG